MTNTNDKASQL